MRRASSIALAALLCAGAAQAETRHNRVERSRAERAEAIGAQPQAFDGAWAIEAVTTVGDCVALVPASLTIHDRKITGAADIATTLWGYVEGDGAIVARFTGHDGRTVRAHGRLRNGGGSGAWSSNTDMCGGVWRAYRAGSERAEN